MDNDERETGKRELDVEVRKRESRMEKVMRERQDVIKKLVRENRRSALSNGQYSGK